MKNLLRYLLVISINIVFAFIYALNCNGERCLAIFLFIVYNLIVIISYLPYLALSKSIKKYKILYFLSPSLLMLLGLITYIKVFSNTEINRDDLQLILLSILPNTILQTLIYIQGRKYD